MFIQQLSMIDRTLNLIFYIFHKHEWFTKKSYYRNFGLLQKKYIIEAY